MSGLLAALLLAISLFLAGLLLIALDNLSALRRLDSYPAPRMDEWPLISILVPARNEAHVLAACARSLLAQRYPRFELLILDDHSTDATPALLRALAVEDARLRPLAGQPLPAGWLGKHWACHQLAEQARGDLLLFTDADTVHQPEALRQAVAALLVEDAGLVSVLPRQVLGSFGEQMVVPLLPWSLACFYPQRLARAVFPALPGRASLRRHLTTAVGQFMLFRRRAYQQGGGHSAVRANVVDDIALARALARQGVRCRLLDAGPLVTCRMYRSFTEASQGFGKNLLAAFDYRAPALLSVWLWLALVYAFPWLALLSGRGGWLAGLAAALELATWALAARRFRLPWRVVPLSPLIVMLGFGLALRSWRLTRTGRAVWKGRPLPAP